MVGVVVADRDVAAHDDDDRRSTSTVASTAGTGVFSLASRMAALAVDFSDKLEGGVGELEGSILEEVTEAEGNGHGAGEDSIATRSERSITTAPVSLVGDDVDEAAEDEAVEAPLGRHGTHGTDSPDPYYVHRLPLQVGICVVCGGTRPRHQNHHTSLHVPVTLRAARCPHACCASGGPATQQGMHADHGVGMAPPLYAPQGWLNWPALD